MKILCITPITDSMMENLKSRGSVDYHPRADKMLVRSLLSDEDYGVVFTNPNKQNFMLDEEVLRDSAVSIICTASTGLNHIDIEYCKKNDIKVLSITKDYVILEKISSTAEHSFALMMSLIRKIPTSFDSAKAGRWDWESFTGRQINQLTVGIVGLGRLGKMMAKYCDSFGAKVLVYDPYVDAGKYTTADSLGELFSHSDVVSLHVHVSDDTKHFINKSVIEEATKPLYLINTSRGEIVDERDVVNALENGTLAGYATDVLEDEFGDLSKSPVLKSCDDLNIIVTPHIGGMTTDAREIAYNAAINKLGEQ